jgi:MFS family permease
MTHETEAVATAARPHTSLASTWAASTFDAMNVPAYRIIWLGTILAFLAFNMSMTAQGVVAYDLTGNNRAVGLVIFGQGVAMLLLNPFGGAVADRFSRRFLIIFAQTMIGGVCLALAILIVTDAISIAFLAAGAFIVGCMFSFLGPTRTALIGEVIGEERMGNAIALIQVGGNFSRISGPFIAGGLLAWPVVGPAGTFFIIAGIFVFVIATFFRLPPAPPRAESEDRTILEDVRAGFRHITENPLLLHTVVSFHLVTVLGLSYFVLMPGFAKDVLDAGTAGLGVLLGTAALGGLIMSLIVASLADSRRAPIYLLMGSFGLGASLIFLGLAPSFPVAILVMLFVGGGASAFQTLNNAIAMRLTDPDYFGRVIGLIFLAWGLNSLVSLPVGVLADLLGERAVISGCGAILCGFVVLLGLWRRRLGPLELAPANEGMTAAATDLG